LASRGEVGLARKARERRLRSAGVMGLSPISRRLMVSIQRDRALVLGFVGDWHARAMPGATFLRCGPARTLDAA
jgi:hypothetical protein